LNIPSVRVLKQGVEQAQREKCALEITNTIFPPPPTHTRSRTHTLLCGLYFIGYIFFHQKMMEKLLFALPERNLFILIICKV